MAHAIALPLDPSTQPEPLLVYDPHDDRPTAIVEIVVPVHNEADGLEDSIRTLHAYLTQHFPLSWAITIADNASTDRTWPIACRLALILDGVRAVHLADKGRGRALRAVWSTSASPVVAYMDVDLSTDLAALLPLVAPLVSGHSDVAIGTRLAATARVARGPKREAISRTYNLLLRATLHAGFSDAQCGFKAVRTDAVRQLLPMVVDQGWFFDTELLVLAEHNGLRIHEVPVDWIDDPDSRVDVVSTARGDLAGMWRMIRRFARNDAALPAGSIGCDAVAVDGTAVAVPSANVPGQRPFAEQLVRFGSIGLVSSAVFALGFVLLAGPLGHMAAAIVALSVCSVANHAANRRLTFALAGPDRRLRHFARGLVVSVLPFAATIATLSVLAAIGATRTLTALATLTVVNIVVGLVRFGLMQRWVFRSQQ
ncbi:MAG: Undecaprenyl-phosphate mannosyltransferase [Ilumatobacteraceae bacterium]|nr:Undecaprenyl-phosphate mannosyltransferase [Ilumatobacteraceae bacterium]